MKSLLKQVNGFITVLFMWIALILWAIFMSSCGKSPSQIQSEMSQNGDTLSITIEIVSTYPYSKDTVVVQSIAAPGYIVSQTKTIDGCLFVPSMVSETIHCNVTMFEFLKITKESS